MVDSAVRVALLARPGNARDQLRRALTELGATLVAEGDPSELDPGTVAANSPTLVLVSLEPAIEASLDRFDDLLATPGVEVMYDDAETTRQLDGWDLNRWARHLAAKLVGRDVLPPPPSGADQLPETDFTPAPGMPPTPAQLMDGEKLEDYAQDAPDLADWVPTNPSLTDNAMPTQVVASSSDDLSLGIDLGDIELAMQGLEPPHAVSDEMPMAGATEIDDPAAALPTLDEEFSLDFDAEPGLAGSADAPVFDTTPSASAGATDVAADDFSFEFDAGSGSSSTLEDEFILAAEAPHAAASDEFVDASDNGGLALDDTDEPLLADIDFNAEPVRFSNFDDDASTGGEGAVDADIAALAAQLDTFEQSDTRQQVKDPDFSLDFSVDEPEPNAPATQEAAAPPTASAIASKMDFSNLTLLDESADLGVAPSAAAPTSALVDAVNLELAPMDGDYQDFAPGAVVIVAGLGGPDAVRQMLASLPDTMPVPVLLYQHLEVGKHERLAEQLGKISKLPVVLAEEGTFAQPGKLFVLPAGMSATSGMRTLRFGAGPLADLFAALTPTDSVVVMLSGADASLVPSAIQLLNAGGIAMAQDPESCFDPAAAQMMASQGAPTFPALGLSQQIAERWSS